MLALIASLGCAIKCLRLDWGNYLTVMGYIFFTALSLSVGFYIQEDKRQERDKVTRKKDSRFVPWFICWVRFFLTLQWCPSYLQISNSAHGRDPLPIGNLWISGASLSQVEKFQCSSTLPNIKYNSAIYFCVKCTGHLCMLQNIVFRWLPLYNPIRIDWYAQKLSDVTELPAGDQLWCH